MKERKKIKKLIRVVNAKAQKMSVFILSFVQIRVSYVDTHA